MPTYLIDLQCGNEIFWSNFAPISKFPSPILKASGKTLSIESYGPKQASTECEMKVSFPTQVTYFFHQVSVKFIFGLLPQCQCRLGR